MRCGIAVNDILQAVWKVFVAICRLLSVQAFAIWLELVVRNLTNSYRNLPSEEIETRRTFILGNRVYTIWVNIHICSDSLDASSAIVREHKFDAIIHVVLLNCDHTSFIY